jgi:hypothetical protein
LKPTTSANSTLEIKSGTKSENDWREKVIPEATAKPTRSQPSDQLRRKRHALAPAAGRSVRLGSPPETLGPAAARSAMDTDSLDMGVK